MSPALPTRFRETTVRMLSDINSQLEGYVQGQVTVAIVVAIMFCIMFKIVGLRYGMTFGIMAGFLNMVPYLGKLSCYGTSCNHGTGARTRYVDQGPHHFLH